MAEQTVRERLHEKLQQASVFYRSSEREHQQAYLDDIIEEFLGVHLDEVAAQGLEYLDSLQRVGSAGAGKDEGWSW